MDFSCFVCLKKFDTIENTILHLKNFHQLRNNAQNLKCVAKSGLCNTSVRTFTSLKKHSLLCSKSNQISDFEKQVNI